jgi:hypothetical protein
LIYLLFRQLIISFAEPVAYSLLLYAVGYAEPVAYSLYIEPPRRGYISSYIISSLRGFAEAASHSNNVVTARFDKLTVSYSRNIEKNKNLENPFFSLDAPPELCAKCYVLVFKSKLLRQCHNPHHITSFLQDLEGKTPLRGKTVTSYEKLLVYRLLFTVYFEHGLDGLNGFMDDSLVKIALLRTKVEFIGIISKVNFQSDSSKFNLASINLPQHNFRIGRYL